MKGRTIVAIVLISFVLVATGVIWRRSYGSIHAREQRKLDEQRSALVAERAKLEGDIRDASSRAKLVPVAEQRLNMHFPSDSLVIDLERPTRKKANGSR